MATTVRDEALKVIADRLGGDLLIVNSTSFAQSDLAFWPSQLAAGQTLQQAEGAAVLIQPTTDGTWIDPGSLPPFSITPLSITSSEAQIENPRLSESQRPPSGRQSKIPIGHAVENLIVTPTLLENDYLRVELNEAGDISRIYDKANQREIVPAGARANQFQAFEDRPMSWDAWDVDIFYDDKMWTSDPATSVEVVEAGPLRATLEVRRRILHSDYMQRISLTYYSPRLDFDTRIDWCERHILLKVAFPVDILSPVATYEIQWGNVQRPTHRNTSWDWARFETCAQKWVDLSEGDYGVSLLNDCKYGHDIQDNVIRLSLLRSPTTPDPEADQGKNRFAYSLLPHAGSWGETTIAAAYALNDPLFVVQGQGGREAAEQPSKEESLISSNRPNIVIETIKQAEDGQGMIIRFYESQRQRGLVTLTAGFTLGSVWQTNLLEENQVALIPVGNTVSLFVKPYQIVTLRMVPL
jgi:alpha-mannosidase